MTSVNTNTGARTTTKDNQNYKICIQNIAAHNFLLNKQAELFNSHNPE